MKNDSNCPPVVPRVVESQATTNENRAIEKLGQKIPNTSGLDDRPEQLTWAIHRAWKDAGGTVGGKPRHSDRFLTDQLRAQGLEVKSLTPKLVGKTRLRPDDASTIIQHFLSNWPQKNGSSDDAELGYAPLMQSEEIAEIVRLVSTRIGKLTSKPSSGSASPSSTRVDLQDMGELLPRYYEQCDCLFTVGTERPIVAQHPRSELLGFRNLMNVFREIDVDGKIRPLVWVLDIGRQVFQERDVEARQRYLALQALLSRFKALRLFEDRDRAERWEWLKSRAFFIVLDTRTEHRLVGVKRPNFLPHHLSLSAIAPSWAMNAGFRALYGSELERLDQRSFSVFLKVGGWNVEDEDSDEDTFNCRSFGYAQFTPDSNKPDEKIGKGLELPFPGASYEEAYRTAYAATLEYLKLDNPTVEIDLSGEDALSQLRVLGFRVMGLEEFMQL